jgi:amino acid adenylation domain-containing protein
MLVQHFLEESARRLPDKVALVSEGKYFSYRDIDRCANRLAHALIAGGVRRGDRVAIFLENGPEAVVAIFAALKADAIFVVINPTTKTDKLAYVLNDAAPRALVTHTAKLPIAAPALEQTDVVQMVTLVGLTSPLTHVAQIPVRSWDTVMEQCPPTRPPSRNIDLDLATIIYTSGSTGRAKGVMSTHLNVGAAATSIIEYLGNTEQDVILCALPLAFDYGLYQLLMSFKAGARLVLERGFVFPYKVIELMQREGVTGFPGVPTIFTLLLGLKDLAKHPLPALRYLTNTAAALPVSHILQLRDAFPQARLFSMYGLTECKRVCYLPPEELERRPDSVGKAIPNTEVYLVDEHDERAEPGAVGELVVRGAHVMQGYWNDPDATAQRFRRIRGAGGVLEQILYTGDLFRADEEGFLYFVGRKDDIIKSRGEKVAPKEVEHVVYALEGVQDAAVIGVPDPVLGEAIKLFVAPRPGVALDERAIREHCKRNLEDFMAPRYIELRASLPKGATGKIDKKALASAPAPELEPVAV